MTSPALGNRRIDQLLAEYGESHRNSTNATIHWIAVPVIAWCVLALVAQLPMPQVIEQSVPLVSWATILAAAMVAYYLALSWSLALGMAAFVATCIAIIELWPEALAPLWATAVTLFAVAWLFQFIGHQIEDKKPSFFKDLQFLLIGPAWLMHLLYRRFGWSY